MQLCWQYFTLWKDGFWKASCYSFQWPLRSGRCTKSRFTHVLSAHYDISLGQLRYHHSSLQVSTIQNRSCCKGGYPLIGYGLIRFKQPVGPAYLKFMDEIPNDGLIRYRGSFNRNNVLLTSPHLRRPSEEACWFWKACRWPCFHAAYSWEWTGHLWRRYPQISTQASSPHVQFPECEGTVSDVLEEGVPFGRCVP